MRKYIIISLLSMACLLQATAAPYAHSRISKSTLLGTRTSISYGRYSTGIGRHTMDMSDRRMELTRNSDGRQEVKTNGYRQGYSQGYSSYRSASPAPRSSRSVFTMVEQPRRVSAYQPHAVTAQRSSATRQELTAGWEPEAKAYNVLSSTVGIESLFHPGSYGGGSSSSAVCYGRTSNGESALQHTVASFAGSARPASIASTTVNSQSDSDSPSSVQQFGENPSYDSAPLCDALLPLLLLISLLAIYKSIKQTRLTQ